MAKASPRARTSKANAAREMTTAEATVAALLAHGIDTIFALPGLHNDPLFDAFYGAGKKLRVLHTRHEQTAGYMALGAALATGKPQAFAVVPGPGFLNASAALLTATGTNAPVLGLLGQIPAAAIDRGFGHLHEIRDQLGMAAHITKFTARISSADRAPHLVAEAIRASLTGRQGPSVLECAIDVWGRKGAVTMPDMPLPVPRPPVDDDAVEAAAKILGKAKRPIIVVGGGAQDASKEVTKLAEMLEAPVIAYRRGQGVVSARHRLSVNMPIGHRLWADADAVIGIGTRLFVQYTQWGIDKNLPVVRIDIDPEEPARFQKPAAALVGDAADYARALTSAPAEAQHQAGETDRGTRRPPCVAGGAAFTAAASIRIPPGDAECAAGRRRVRRRGGAARIRGAPRLPGLQAAHVSLSRLPGQSRMGIWHRARR